MKLIISFILLLVFSISSIAQTLQDLSFGTNNTLEVVTWNIENFPKNGTTTKNAVKDIILALDADVYALQEINSSFQLNNMVAELPDYTAYYQSVYYGGLAYVYNTSTVQIKNIYEIYTSTTESYRYNFPRKPMVMEMTFKNEDYIIINNHLKCCGDGSLDKYDTYDEEYKRYTAMNMIKEYIDTHFSDKNVLVVGDLNDVLDDSAPDNVFQTILDDPNNYKFADQEIAEGNSSNWSFPGWPSHLDHILISNELFDELADPASAIQTIRVDDYLAGGLSEYDTNITDHRPVGIKLFPGSSTNTSDLVTKETTFYCSPNPLTNNTKFHIATSREVSNIEIYNIVGQRIENITITKGEEVITWNAEHLSKGIYIARLMSGNTPIAETKLMKK